MSRMTRSGHGRRSQRGVPIGRNHRLGIRHETGFCDGQVGAIASDFDPSERTVQVFTSMDKRPREGESSRNGHPEPERPFSGEGGGAEEEVGLVCIPQQLQGNVRRTRHLIVPWIGVIPSHETLRIRPAETEAHREPVRRLAQLDQVTRVIKYTRRTAHRIRVVVRRHRVHAATNQRALARERIWVRRVVVVAIVLRTNTIAIGVHVAVLHAIDDIVAVVVRRSIAAAGSLFR